MTEEIDNFMVPPTPTRVGISLEHSICEDPFQDSLFNDGGDGSLAILTGEVVEAQKYQASELTYKEVQLTNLKTEVRLNKKIYETVQSDVNSINRQLYLIQDKVCESQKNCSLLLVDIVELLDQKRQLQSKHLDIKWKQKQIDIQYTQYREKMKKFRNKVQSFHKQNLIHMEIIKLKDEIESQNNILSSLLNNEANVTSDHMMYQDGITDLTVTSNTLESENIQLQEQICKEKECVCILKKEIDALHKRNIAQMSRLKRQIRESNERVARRKNENLSLEEKIAVMKRK